MYVPNDPLPTFADWKDRAAFLLAEYKIPVSATILAFALYMAFARPSTPDPPQEVMDFLASFMLLSIPTFLVSKKVVEWLLQLRMENVMIANGGDPPDYHVQHVPPAIWEDKTVVGAAPLDVRDLDGWADWVVTDFEWVPEIEELRIRGSRRTNLEPGERETSEAKVEAVYSHYVAVLQAFSKLKGRTAELMQLAHDDAMMSSIRVKDKMLSPQVSATDAIEEATEDEQDELPELGELVQEVDLPEYEEPEAPPDPGGDPGE